MPLLSRPMDDPFRPGEKRGTSEFITLMQTTTSWGGNQEYRRMNRLIGFMCVRARALCVSFLFHFHSLGKGKGDVYIGFIGFAFDAFLDVTTIGKLTYKTYSRNFRRSLGTRL